MIDYIGNHRTFLLKPQTLFELAPTDAAIERALNHLLAGEVDLPPGCEVTYDLESSRYHPRAAPTPEGRRCTEDLL